MLGIFGGSKNREKIEHMCHFTRAFFTHYISPYAIAIAKTFSYQTCKLHEKPLANITFRNMMIFYKKFSVKAKNVKCRLPLAHKNTRTEHYSNKTPAQAISPHAITKYRRRTLNPVKPG